MANKLPSKKTAEKIIIGGAIGLITSIALSYILLMSTYGRVGDCFMGVQTCSDNFAVEQFGSKLAASILFGSLGALTTGLIVLLILSIKTKHQQTKQARRGTSNPNE